MSYFDDFLFYAGIDISSYIMQESNSHLVLMVWPVTAAFFFFFFSFNFSLYIVYSNVIIAHQGDLARKFVLNWVSIFRRWAVNLEVTPYRHRSNMEGFQDFIVRRLVWVFAKFLHALQLVLCKTLQAVNLD